MEEPKKSEEARGIRSEEEVEGWMAPRSRIHEQMDCDPSVTRQAHPSPLLILL